MQSDRLQTIQKKSKKYLDYVKKKFQTKWTSRNETKQFQITDPSQYSSIYKDDLTLDQQKKLSFLTKCQGFQKIQIFLEKIDFESLINANEIFTLYFHADAQCCIFELDEILQIENKMKFFILPPYSSNKVKFLNQGIDNISLILIEYIKGLYYREQIQSEFMNSYQEIMDFIYKRVRNQAKLTQRNIYKQLQHPLNQIYNNLIQKNDNIRLLQHQIYCQGFQLIEIKQMIEQLYKEIQVKFQDLVQINYTFAISQVILAPFLIKIDNYYHKSIMDSLRVYRSIENEIYYENIRNRIELTFVKYLQKQQFEGGIQIYDINLNLQCLIYSIDWEFSDVVGIAIQVLSQITQDCHNMFENKKFVIFKGRELDEEVLLNFKKYYKNECDQAKKWWNQNINEEQNLNVIFQVYILIARIYFIDKQLYFGHYEPTNRITLTLILRVLNNGKYHYLNQTILKLCENITFQVQQQIFNDIENKMELIQQRQPQSILDQPLIIKLQSHKINVRLFSDKQSSINSAKLFYEDNKLLFQIIRTTFQVDQIIKKQNELIQTKLLLIKQKYTDFLGQSLLENIKFETLTLDNSNVITLAISGFLSGDYDKSSYWKGLLQQGCGTVIALHWNCGQPIDFAKYIANQIIPKFSSKIDIKKIIKSNADSIKYNNYKSAHDEAIKVGKYLAFLIAEHKLFGNCQINIVVHSLGSVILLECIKLLDSLYSTYKRQYINQILIMGGVVDVNKLKRRKWNSVGGTIYNVYSKKDQVLMYILKIPALFDSPCGLQKIDLGYMPVVNCDFTDIVNGHFDYKNQLERILIQTDFNNDFKYMTSEIIQQF